VEFVVQKAAELNLPVVSTMLSRDQTPNATNYYGVYLGDAASLYAKRLVEGADLVLMLGEGCSDVTISPDCFKTLRIIKCISRQIQTDAHTYGDVPLAAFLKRCLLKWSQNR
jgi:TPP-dependent 2-oxoacid decarboxylase